VHAVRRSCCSCPWLSGPAPPSTAPNDLRPEPQPRRPGHRNVHASPSPARPPPPPPPQARHANPLETAPAPAKPVPRPTRPPPPPPSEPIGPSEFRPSRASCRHRSRPQPRELYAHTAEINRLVDSATHQGLRHNRDRRQDGYSEAGLQPRCRPRGLAALSRCGGQGGADAQRQQRWGPCINRTGAIGNAAHADVAISITPTARPPARIPRIYPASLPGLDRAIGRTFGAPRRWTSAIPRRPVRASPTPPTRSRRPRPAERPRRPEPVRRVPKVFIETGNLHDTADAALLGSGFRQRAAQSLLAGLQEFSHQVSSLSTRRGRVGGRPDVTNLLAVPSGVDRP